MPTRFTHPTHPPGRWLAALTGSLVLWGIAYAQAPAPAPSPSLPGYEVAGFPTTERSRLERLLLSDLDNAVALRQLAAGYAGAAPTSAPRGRAQSPHMVAANTGPNIPPAVPK